MQYVESERRTMMQNYPDFYPLAATAVLIAIGIGIGWMLFADHDGYGMNLWTEVLSIGVTVAVIDRLNQRRIIQERKAELIAQLGSPSNDFALEAARLLRRMGVLEDGSLKQANLGDADLSRAYLYEANLSGADLWGANLSGANLGDANLSGARLIKVNLSGAKLEDANLSGANLLHANLSGANLENVNLSDASLWDANLSGANLLYANLSGANLGDANLSGANLEDANLPDASLDNATFDKNTRLPDGSKWTSHTDVARFTDPQHPNFWRPEWVAYRDNSD